MSQKTILVGAIHVNMLGKCCNSLRSAVLRRAFPGVILDVLDCERLSETDLSCLSQIPLLLADICMLLLGFLGKGWDILRASPSLLTFHAKSLLCEFIYFLFNLNMHFLCRKLLCCLCKEVHPSRTAHTKIDVSVALFEAIALPQYS